MVDDTGCCGFSNVFLQEGEPGPVYRPLLENELVRVYAHPSYLKTVEGFRELVFDAIDDPAGDSFSLETEFGERLVVGLTA